MNYRHAFHAGNFADVMKHAVLARILSYLALKPAPFRVIDTHAGCGAYDLSGHAPNRTGEWREGIGRILGASLPADVEPVLWPYLSVVAPMMREKRPIYPGSPLIAQALMRTQDRLICAEKHPEDARKLVAALAGDRRVKAIEIDGWVALNAQLPPKENRGLILIDPPFEEPGEFGRLARAFLVAYRKWHSGIFALWYPIKDIGAVESFVADLHASNIRKILRLEMWVDQPDSDGPLAGSGMIIVNPPWTLKAECERLLAWLAQATARTARSGCQVVWITPE